MKSFLLIALVLLSVNYSKAQIKELNDFQWTNRLLIIYHSEEAEKTLKDQLYDIENEKTGYAERDLKIIILKNQEVEVVNSAQAISLSFKEILKELKIDPTVNYQNLLIGKDGTVKLREASPISTEKLFNTIDAMPMRQREMRDGN